MEFLNVTLTKTGLTDDIRTINNANSLIFNNTITDSSGNTLGAVGMIAQTRDKILNNLYPESCKITIPKGDTSCNALWHCNDNGSSCTDRTSEAGVSLITNGATTCEWQIPCEFSIWAGGEPGTPSAGVVDDGGSSGGSSGSAGTSFWKRTFTASDEDFKKGYRQELENQHRIRVKINNEDHFVGVVALTSVSATINISSTPQQAIFLIGDEKKFDVTDDEYYDIYVKLDSIVVNKTNITIKSIYEKMPEKIIDEDGDVVGTGGVVDDESFKDKEILKVSGKTWLWIIGIIGVLVGAGIGIWIFYNAKNKIKKNN